MNLTDGNSLEILIGRSKVCCKAGCRTCKIRCEHWDSQVADQTVITPVCKGISRIGESGDLYRITCKINTLPGIVYRNNGTDLYLTGTFGLNIEGYFYLAGKVKM